MRHFWQIFRVKHVTVSSILYLLHFFAVRHSLTVVCEWPYVLGSPVNFHQAHTFTRVNAYAFDKIQKPKIGYLYTYLPVERRQFIQSRHRWATNGGAVFRYSNILALIFVDPNTQGHSQTTEAAAYGKTA